MGLQGIDKPTQRAVNAAPFSSRSSGSIIPSLIARARFSSAIIGNGSFFSKK